MPRFGVSREDPRKARAPIRLVWRQTDAAMESAPARRVPFRMHEKGPKVHIRGVPLMYPPEGCPPLAGWKGHACHSPPRPVFCPDRPRPLAPGCTANPTTQCPIEPSFPACRGSSHKRGAPPPLLWGAPSGCRGPGRASRLREKAASGGVLVWNPKRRAPLRGEKRRGFSPSFFRNQSSMPEVFLDSFAQSSKRFMTSV